MNKPHPHPSPDGDSAMALLGRNVGFWREARGLTLLALAARSGIAADTLRGIEQGQHDPSVDMLDRLAEALGVTHQQLLARTIIGGLSVDNAAKF